jgi:hypothetical protein
MTTHAAIQILTDDERFQKFCDSVLVEVSRLKESSEEGESFNSCVDALKSCLARAGEVSGHLSDGWIMSMNQVVRRKDTVCQ